VTFLSLAIGCVYDGPAGFVPDFEPIDVDVRAEAEAHNGGAFYEFVVDAAGYVSTPSGLSTGEVIVTLTYTDDSPAPHSLVFEGLNGDQPVVAVDLPGSNNGSVVVPSGDLVFFDGAPGNRQKGYEGQLEVAGPVPSVSTVAPLQIVSWAARGLEFTSAPRAAASDVPIALELTVSDASPHSIAFEQVRGEQPLVAVDGPGTNQRTLSVPPGTYVYFCAVPGHREAGMEGLLTFT
jgi:hypothetical protein